MEHTFYAKIIDTADYEGLRYTLLAIAPKSQYDLGEGNFYRTDDETFRQACDIFGEDKLISAGVPYITFVYEDAQDVQGLVEKAEALAEDGNIDLDWFNDDFAAVLANDEYTKVESDDSVARYLRL